MTPEQLSQLKTRYVSLLASMPPKDWETEDAILLNQISKDGDVDLTAAIEATSVKLYGRMTRPLPDVPTPAGPIGLRSV